MTEHEETAWREDFASYFAGRHQMMRRTAFLLCGDWHWADDLAQVAFIRAAASWHRVRDPAARDAFVRTCLFRAYLGESTRAWRRREASTAEPPERTGHDSDPATRLSFLDALRKVPPRQRATLVCRFYQGLDVQETAEALGCSPGTVKSQTARGLSALRTALGDAIDVETALEVQS